MKLVFFGTPEFAVPVLQAVYRAGHEILAVVTQPDRPRGRKKVLTAPEVKTCAKALGLRVLQFEKIKRPEAVQMLADLEADAWVTAAYGQILSKELLALPPKGVINAHASLLPAYRGAAPVNWCLIQGETKTGVTTMYTDVGVDDGDMILRQEECILPEDTAESLLQRLSHIAADLMVKTLALVEKGQAPRTPQEERLATRQPMLCKQDGALDFSQPAETVCNRTRGVTPWPGAFAILDGQTYKFADPFLAKGSGAPGTILAADEKRGLLIACGKDAVGFRQIQAPGKKKMDAKDFLRGHRLDTGKRFGE